MFHNASSVEGWEVHALDGTVGRVREVYFDDREWIVRYLAVDTGSWLDREEVLISTAAIAELRWEEKRLGVRLTREQVRQSPRAGDADISRAHEEELARYYGWPAYWMGASDLGGMSLMSLVGVPLEVAPPPAETVEAKHAVTKSPADPHLRSGRSFRRYRIEAKDGHAGSVEDLVFEEANWKIHYVAMKTSGVLFQGMVVLPTEWISGVDWTERNVSVDLTREAITSSPAYEPSQPFTADYAARLHSHFGRTRWGGW